MAAFTFGGYMNITIREVTEEDAEALSAIYRPYVEETGITFEYVPPDAEEFRRRIQHTKEKYPYLAACDEGKIIGYAYAGTFIGRSASDWNVELSIYMDRNEKEEAQGACFMKRSKRNLGRWESSTCIPPLRAVR